MVKCQKVSKYHDHDCSWGKCDVKNEKWIVFPESQYDNLSHDQWGAKVVSVCLQDSKTTLQTFFAIKQFITNARLKCHSK